MLIDKKYQMKKILIGLIAIAFSSHAQNIETTYDSNSDIGKQFTASVQNFINMLEMDTDEFTEKTKALGFKTRQGDNFCFESFPQCNLGPCGMVYKCVDEVSYLYMDPTSGKSNLLALYNDLSKQMGSNIDNDGSKVFVFKHSITGKRYKIKIKSKVTDNNVNETLSISRLTS